MEWYQLYVKEMCTPSNEYVEVCSCEGTYVGSWINYGWKTMIENCVDLSISKSKILMQFLCHFSLQSINCPNTQSRLSPQIQFLQLNRPLGWILSPTSVGRNVPNKCPWLYLEEPDKTVCVIKFTWHNFHSEVDFFCGLEELYTT